MTKRRALEILRDYWGTGQSVTKSVVSEIEAIATIDESMLRTVARVSGWGDQVLAVLPPYNNRAVKALASYGLARLDLAEVQDPSQKEY